MEQELFTHLRCPIDPRREATLTREQQELICSHCRVRFPVKQGIPILLASEATLPDNCEKFEALRCLKRRS